MNVRWRVAQFFEIRWWRQYLRNKDKAVYLDWKRAYWRDFLAQSGLRLSPGARALDAGCGPAGIFMALDAQQTDALDPLLPAYDQLSIFKRSDYPWTRFIDQPLEDFQTDERYDCVFCLNAVNHVSDLARCFDRLSALTGPQGVLAVSVDAHNHAWLKRIFRALPGDILHPHQYDVDEYEAMIRARGMHIVRRICLKKERIFSYFLLIAAHEGTH